MPPTHAESLSEAARLAQSGNPAKALELLLPLSSGKDAALHHYTLGALYLQNAEPGHALAHLLCAKALGAPSEQIAGALVQARSLAEARAGSTSLERASSPWERVGDSLLILPAESLFATLALVASLRLWRDRERSAARRRRLALCVGLAAAALFLATLHGLSLLSPRARALGSLEVRSGPGEDFPLVGEASSGAELRIAESAPRLGWVRVRVSPQLEGWADASRVLPLTGALNPGPTEAEEQRP